MFSKTSAKQQFIISEYINIKKNHKFKINAIQKLSTSDTPKYQLPLNNLVDKTVYGKSNTCLCNIPKVN